MQPPFVPTDVELSSVMAVETWLDQVRERLGASRWSVAVQDDPGWHVVSHGGSLRDEVISHLIQGALLHGLQDVALDGAVLVDVADLGDAGARLRASGVDRLLVAPAGPTAWLCFDSPDVSAARRFVETRDGTHCPLDVAGLLQAEAAAQDLLQLTDWWPVDATSTVVLRTRPGELLAERLRSAAASAAQTSESSRRNSLLRERARIASVIHEGITQVLTNVAIQLEVLGHVAEEPDTVRDMVAGSREAVLQALDSLRSVIFDLTPPTEEWTDLVAGLRGFVADFSAQWGLQVRLEVAGLPRELDAEIVSLAFAFVQEGLTNVRKHAHVDRAQVRLSYGTGTITVEIADEGVGVDGHEEDGDLRRHQGLSIMASRVRLLSGRFEVESVPAGGTLVRMEVPA